MSRIASRFLFEISTPRLPWWKPKRPSGARFAGGRMAGSGRHWRPPGRRSASGRTSVARGRSGDGAPAAVAATDRDAVGLRRTARSVVQDRSGGESAAGSVEAGEDRELERTELSVAILKQSRNCLRSGILNREVML